MMGRIERATGLAWGNQMFHRPIVRYLFLRFGMRFGGAIGVGA